MIFFFSNLESISNNNNVKQRDDVFSLQFDNIHQQYIKFINCGTDCVLRNIIPSKRVPQCCLYYHFNDCCLPVQLIGTEGYFHYI